MTPRPAALPDLIAEITRLRTALADAHASGWREAVEAAARVAGDEMLDCQRHQCRAKRDGDDYFVGVWDGLASMAGGIVAFPAKLVREAAAALGTQAARIVELEADNERLRAGDGVREALVTAQAVLIDAPELNPSNYDHEQVCQLNTAAIEAYSILTAALNPEPRPTTRETE